MAVFYSKRCTRGKELLLLVVGVPYPTTLLWNGSNQSSCAVRRVAFPCCVPFHRALFASTSCRQRQAAPQTIAGAHNANRSFRQARHKSRTPHRAAQPQAAAEPFKVKIAVRLGQVFELPARI